MRKRDEQTCYREGCDNESRIRIWIRVCVEHVILFVVVFHCSFNVS